MTMQAARFKAEVSEHDHRREDGAPWNRGLPSKTGEYDVRLRFKTGAVLAYFYAPTQSWYTGWFGDGTPNEEHRLTSVIAWKEHRGES